MREIWQCQTDFLCMQALLIRVFSRVILGDTSPFYLCCVSGAQTAIPTALAFEDALAVDAFFQVETALHEYLNTSHLELILLMVSID
jgi:hypothetical protein